MFSKTRLVAHGEFGICSIELNGATAHLGRVGDRLTIMSFAQVPQTSVPGFQPQIALLNDQNRVLHDLDAALNFVRKRQTVRHT